MNWFYAQDGRQAGPVEDNELDRLVQAGAIEPDTLVWHSGMANWLPYSQARATAAPAPVPAPVSPYAPGGSSAVAAYPAVGGTLATTAQSTGQVRCSECQQVFPTDEVVQVEGLNVCANCKPIVLQKLREGLRPAGAGFHYGGFWWRFLAVFIDGIIVRVFAGIVGFILGAALGAGSAESATQGGAAVLIGLVGFAIGASYEIIFIAKAGATPGKMACGLRVVRPDGSPISLARSTGRYFSKILSGIILGIGYIMAAFDAEKRALHDQICDTRVIKK